jgi:4-amino-4-deoxy-L-arabinose transferase-like glycosyltransferase
MPSTSGPFRRAWEKHPIFFVVLAALAFRMIVVACGFRAQAAPSVSHAEFGWEMGWVARSIFLGHGFSSPFLPLTGPTAMVPPLFPYLLAGMFHFFGLYTAKAAFAILSINSLLSALTCIPIYYSARYALGQKAAVWAAVAWAVYPYAIYFSAARIWDYALTGLLFTTCFCFAQRLHRSERLVTWLGFGAFYGVTALANPSVLPMFPVFLLLAVLQIRRDGERWWKRCLVASFGVVVVLTPWTIHNYRAMHFVGPVRDNFWLECWAGNNGDTFESNARWAHPASNALEMTRFQAVGEIGYIAEKKAMALDFIEHHPLFFTELSLRRAFAYWTGFWSFNPAYLGLEPLEIPDVFFCTGMTLLMLLGARLFWREDRVEALPFLILILLFPLTYYFTHASPDYRQPIEPEVIVLAVMGVMSLKGTRKPVEVAEKAVEGEKSQLAMSMSMSATG